MWAAYRGHGPVVELLISSGAVVDGTSKNGSSALISAAYKGNVSVVNYLVQIGANVNMQVNPTEPPHAHTPSFRTPPLIHVP